MGGEGVGGSDGRVEENDGDGEDGGLLGVRGSVPWGAGGFLLGGLYMGDK